MKITYDPFFPLREIVMKKIKQQINGLFKRVEKSFPDWLNPYNPPVIGEQWGLNKNGSITTLERFGF